MFSLQIFPWNKRGGEGLNTSQFALHDARLRFPVTYFTLKRSYSQAQAHVSIAQQRACCAERKSPIIFIIFFLQHQNDQQESQASFPSLNTAPGTAPHQEG